MSEQASKDEITDRRTPSVRPGFVLKAFCVIAGLAMITEACAPLMSRLWLGRENIEASRFNRDALIPWELSVKRGKREMLNLDDELKSGRLARAEFPVAIRKRVLPLYRPGLDQLISFRPQTTESTRRHAAFVTFGREMVEGLEQTSNAIEQGDAKALAEIQRSMASAQERFMAAMATGNAPVAEGPHR